MIPLRQIIERLEALLCDKCLALYQRNPELPIGEFCERCQEKLQRRTHDSR
jgi:hypothetical protein